MKSIRSALSAPLYLFSVFTTAKSFSHNPVLGNRTLNRLGLHVARLVLSHGVFAFKQLVLSPLVSRDDYRAFRKNGFIVKEDFLPAGDFARVRDEAKRFSGEAWQCVQGDTVTWRAFLDAENLARLPACRELSANPAYLRLLKFAAGKNERPLLYIQQIQNGFVSAQPDPQKTLHADTFHPTMKAWLFLQDVDTAGGPFTYVSGSNRLTWARIKWEYRRSLEAGDEDNAYSGKGSPRLDESALAGMGLPPSHGFAVRANTLVVANTFGFHRRGDVTRDRATRLEIWAMSRINPFNPWPGLGIPLFADLRDKWILRGLRRRDDALRKVGKKSSWHRAPVSPAE